MRGAHIIAGVAGHVDHGKTLLTQALTGVETDRLPEEKKRGMTIVPGFAPLPLEHGRHLALIDVPGHERFVKNMLAGASGVDMALLVVAGDEGVMPQTEEHLHILHLLGVSHGVVAITKCDLIDRDRRKEVRRQVAALLASTALAGAPLVAVSARTGEGLDALKAQLDRVSAGVPPRPAAGACRLPIDRVFTVHGFGTVATGTLWSGRVELGQRLELLPSGAVLRVRGIEVHGVATDTAGAGQRVALNLAGDETLHLTPGGWLTQPGLLGEHHRLDISLTLLPLAPTLSQRTRVRVFHGTREVLGRVRLLDRQTLAPGEDCLCQLELEQALAPLPGDRMILRACTPIATIGGGRVLDVSPPRYRLCDPETMRTIGKKNTPGSAQALLGAMESYAAPLPLPQWCSRAGISPEEGAAALAALAAEGMAGRLIVEGSDCYYATALAHRWQRALGTLLEGYHKKHPLRRGIPTAALRQRLFPAFSAHQLAALLENFRAQRLISVSDGLVSTPHFICAPTPRQQHELDGLLALFFQQPFAPPDWAQAVALLDISPAHAGEYLQWLLFHDRLTRAGDVLFATRAVRQAELRLRGAFSEFTLAQARDLLGSTRKYTLALLELFDRRGGTLRQGDVRRFLNE